MRSATPRRGLLLGALGILAVPRRSIRAQPQDAAAAEDVVADDSPFDITPQIATPAHPLPSARERWIWAVNNANEEVAVAYRTGEAYLPGPMAQLQGLFRDLRENTPGPLPPLLVDMLSLLQERYGYQRPLRVLSGFRTLRTNMSLEGAAPNSFHLHGYAADFYLPRVPVLDVAIATLELSRRFGFMGVGFYRQFVHVDVGPARAWTSFDA
ncbi:MAG TPA: DUF882 domain-containing protein [Acetobacteraceae bacterium]|nr:DUF882 domain-containing protein [Acetobacteraceae bacterium]